ncbi:MAG: iron-sulfur cluster assembly accessory protein [Saprospiraceae bacterium]
MSVTTADQPKKTATTPISLTDTAVEQLHRIRTEKQIPADLYLRIGAKGGGCAGFTYELGFDERQDGDQQFEVKGIQVVMQKGQALYLLGMEVDWHTGLNNRGFIFNNPNASETCGCGTSFSA